MLSVDAEQTGLLFTQPSYISIFEASGSLISHQHNTTYTRYGKMVAIAFTSE